MGAQVFSVKYTSDADTDHLIRVLKTLHKIIVNKEGLNVCGLHLYWNYDREYVDIFMPHYIQKSLDRLSN